MKWMATLLALAAAWSSPWSAHAASAPSATTAARTVSRLRADLDALVAARELPGAIAIIARDGRTVADIVTGWSDIDARRPLGRDALFRLYSMSKPITSLAIMMLVERGKIGLDDPIERYLPAFRDMRVYASGDAANMVTVPAARPITIADLLTHRSGLTYHFAGKTPVHRYYRANGVLRDTPVGRLPDDAAPARTLDELMQRLARAPLLHQPGRTFEYSYSTTVLGAVIARVAGEPLDHYLQGTIFRPLRMTDTGFFVSDARLPRFTPLYGPGMKVVERPDTSDYRRRDRLLDGGGAIVGTAGDYVRFAQMLANGGRLDRVRLLRPDSVDALFTPRTTVVGVAPQPLRFGYGFLIGDAASEAAGFQPANAVGWAGSGGTVFYVDRQNRSVALLMTHVLGGSESARRSLIRAAVSLTRP